MIDTVFNTYKSNEVIRSVCTVMDITEEQLLSKKRNRILVDARRIVVNILRREEYVTTEVAGKAVNRDHSTAVHLQKTHPDIYEIDKQYKAIYDSCIFRYKDEIHFTFDDFVKIGERYNQAKERIEVLEIQIEELENKLLIENTV